MSRISFRLFLLVTLASLLATQSLAQNSSVRRRVLSRQPVVQKPESKPAAAIPPAPAPVPELQVQTQAPVPPAPPKPVDMPAVPPQVSFVKGQLLIEARNSTLNDILEAVRKATGATIDIASGDTSERVVGRIGPGLARDVLTDLLNGTKFNYVMLSPSGDAAALDKVILTPKTVTLASASSGGSMAQPMATPSGPVFTQAPPGTTPSRALLQQLQPQVMPVQQQPPTADEEPATDTADEQDQNAAGTVQATPEASPQPAQPQNPASMQEQMIQELQRRYQDRINMQQKQNQPPQPPQNQ